MNLEPDIVYTPDKIELYPLSSRIHFRPSRFILIYPGRNEAYPTNIAEIFIA